MTYWKKIARAAFWLLILALLVAPLGLIYEISAREMKQYEVPQAPIFHETAYGSAVKPQRMDLRESVSVSGVFRSDSYAYMELSQEDPSKIRWNVSVGDEIALGQALGSYLGQDVRSTVEGLITEISLYNDPYLKVRLYTPVVLETYLDRTAAKVIGRAKSLTAGDGSAVTVVSASKIPDEQGMIRMTLSFAGDRYTLGDRLADEALYTGTAYLQALVLPEDCLYQKIAGEDEPWYVRQVSANGFFIGEMQVEKGYGDGNYCCVSGVGENQYFDSGYKAIVGNG